MMIYDGDGDDVGDCSTRTPACDVQKQGQYQPDNGRTHVQGI